MFFNLFDQKFGKKEILLQFKIQFPILIYFKIKQLFQIIIIFFNISVLTVFLIK